MTVLDIGLRVVCNDKDGCVSRLEAVGSDYRGFSFQRFPGTVSEGYGMLSKSVEARKGRIASPEQERVRASRTISDVILVDSPCRRRATLSVHCLIVANIWQSGFRCQTPSSAAWAEKRVQRKKEKNVYEIH